MFGKKEKELVDRELAIYKGEKALEIERDIFSRMHNNWKSLDDVRQESVSKQVAARIEAAKAEAKSEALSEVAKIKDREIALLKDLLTEAIKALQPKDSATKH